MSFLTRIALGISAFYNVKSTEAFIDINLAKERIICASASSDVDEITPAIIFSEDTTILKTEPSHSTWNLEDDWTKLSGTYSDASHFKGQYDKPSSEEDLLLAAEQFDILKKKKLGTNWEPSADVPILHDDTYIEDDADRFVDDAVETILNHLDYDDAVALYDTGEFSSPVASDEDQHDDEMVHMIRCNQSPGKLLLAQGKVLSELTHEEKYAARFLFENLEVIGLMSQQPKMTSFFENAVQSIFNKYSLRGQDSEDVMDRNGLAKWMTKCLSYDLSSSTHDSKGVKIGRSDNSISMFLSRYCSNRLGQLTLHEFTILYLEHAWVGYLNDARRNKDLTLNNGKYHPVPSTRESVIIKDRKNTERFLQDASMSIIWRDLEAHDIFSPAEIERVELLKEMEHFQRSFISSTPAAFDNDENILLDECELMDDYEDMLSKHSDGEYGVKKSDKNSHEFIEMARDGVTPKRMRDGEFVFIDEESCIGCSQCATIAPDSFTMLEDTGRARTYFQRHSDDIKHAVQSCPVNCMHMVSFDELKEMELFRDEGSFGMTHVPVHVAGRDSDANRKSSWYHYLKAKCGLKSCPQKGCYDCPNYAPGGNPYFQMRHKHAEHVRADDFKASGDADQWRKVAEV